ncbi:MAG: ABC transporter ATP-binding protein [Coriobacteriales bacterium]|nr:ABC transporter ATP-binding protein [Coriobacteriales bacterium]
MNANAFGSNPNAPLGGRPNMREMRFGEHAKPKDTRGTLRRLMYLTKDHRKHLLCVFALSGLVSVAPVLTPLLIGHIIDAIELREPASLLLLALMLVYLGDWLSRLMQQRLMVTTGQHIIRDIRLALFRAIEYLPLSFFDTHRHGELMSRITNDVDNISTTISTSLAQLMVYVFTVTGALIAMLSQNIVLTGVALCAVSLILLFAQFITSHTRPLFRKQQEALGNMNAHIEESISGISLVKAFSREASMVQTFEKANERYLDVAMKAQVWSGLLMPFAAVTNNLSFIAVAVTGGVMAAQGIISVGLISSFLLYSRQFTRPFVDIANIYNTL